MKEIAFADLTEADATWTGALDFDERPGGISPRRLPGWTRPQVPQMLDVMLRMPSGVRLRFETDSTTLVVTALVTNTKFGDGEPRPVVFDLEIGDSLLTLEAKGGNTIVTDAEGGFTVERGEASEMRFENLPAGLKTCELWLPHNAYVELRTIAVDDGALLRAVPDDRPHWVHYGSSISHCAQALQPGLTWPAVAARRAGARLHSLGFGGQCHLDPFVARTIRDADPDLISIKTGINIINMDSMRERIFSPLLHGFLDTIREDWSRLWWIRIEVAITTLRLNESAESAASAAANRTAENAVALLRQKYPQYHQTEVLRHPPTLLALRPISLRSWSATNGHGQD